MKETNIFYPHAVMYLVQKMAMQDKQALTLLLVIVPIPVWLILIPIWYIVDVLSNIMECVCMFIFIDYPLWSYKKLEEYEKIYGPRQYPKWLSKFGSF